MMSNALYKYKPYVERTGNDNCPICQMFEKPKKVMMVNVIDRFDGSVKMISMSEERFSQLFEEKNSFLSCVGKQIRKYWNAFVSWLKDVTRRYNETA